MPIQEEDLCMLIQQDLADVAGRNYPATARTQTGFLSAITSDANTTGVEPTILDTGDGKGKRTALIEFIKPASTADVSTDPESVCEDGVERERYRFTRQITKYARSQNLKFTKEAMRTFCERPQEWRAKVINAELDAFFRVVNRISIGQYLAQVGDFYGGVSGPKSVQMLDGTHAITASDPNGEIEMIQDFQDIGWAGAPLVVGAGHLDTYTKMQDIGCCNAYGQDIGDTAKMAYYFDRDVDHVVGSANNFLAFVPGSVQFASWNQNKGDFGIRHAHFDETTMVDPWTGIELDLEVNYDRCTKEWIVQFGLFFDVFLLPLNMYKEEDDRFQVNGAVQYVATKATPGS